MFASSLEEKTDKLVSSVVLLNTVLVRKANIDIIV